MDKHLTNDELNYLADILDEYLLNKNAMEGSNEEEVNEKSLRTENQS